MGHAVLNLVEENEANSSYLRLISGGHKINGYSVAIPSREIIILGIILAFLQILDGVLTGIGMYHFGTTAEGNLMLQSLMNSIGYLPALLITKVAAMFIIGALCFMSMKVAWLDRALRAIIFIYLGAAIIPWSVILLIRIV